jgi:hypothetical protein
VRQALITGAITLACALGCSSFLHAKDPVVQSVSCALTAAVLGPLEALAATLGIPLPVLELLYGDACNQAALEGKSQHDAEQFALERVTERARAMHAMGLRVVEPADGGAP